MEEVTSRHIILVVSVLAYWVRWVVVVVTTKFAFWFSWSFRYYSLRMVFSFWRSSISWVFLWFKECIFLCKGMINKWSSSSWREWLTRLVGFLFSRAPITSIPFTMDSCSCDHFPWIKALMLLFVAIDDVVVEGKVFLWPHSGHQMFLLNLVESPHDNASTWAFPWMVMECTYKGILTLKLAT